MSETVTLPEATAAIRCIRSTNGMQPIHLLAPLQKQMLLQQRLEAHHSNQLTLIFNVAVYGSAISVRYGISKEIS